MTLSKPTVLVLVLGFAMACWLAGTAQGRDGAESAVLDSLFAQSLRDGRSWRQQMAEARQEAKRAAGMASGLAIRLRGYRNASDSLSSVLDTLKAQIPETDTVAVTAPHRAVIQAQDAQIRTLLVANDSALALAGVWQVEAGRWRVVAEAAD